jgi:hypothetical protein
MDFNNSEEESSSSKLTFSIQNIVGGENKKKKKNQIDLGNISFKIFDTSVIDGIELKYVYDE